MIKRTFSQWTEHIMHLLILAGTFLLPFGLLVGFITALIFIVWLADPRWRSKGEALRTSPLSWIFISYFLFHALSLIWANNISEAWATTQVKLAFFLLPPVFTFLKVDTKFTQWVLAVFIAGLLCSGIFMLCRAAIILFCKGQNIFYYQQFTAGIMHPSYLAMYYSTGIMILFHGILLQPVFSKKIKFFAIMFCLFFSVLVILISSKLGILSMIAIFIAYIIYAVFRFRRYAVGAFSLATLACGIFIASKLFPQVEGRLETMKNAIFVAQKIDPSDVESNKVRLLVWQADFAIAARHPWNGVGLGDAKDSLVAEYLHRGMTGAAKEKLNAHDQFFQTTIALGVPGLIILLLLFLGPAAWGVRNRFGFVVVFAALFFVNCIPESILEMQAGTLFFGFFYSLILFSADKNCLSPHKAPPLQLFS